MEQEENPQEEFIIKSSDQYFIQHNYKRLTLEELCNATDLDPETITSYIEEYENYMGKNGINVDDKFTFSMNINALGNISYGIQWPSNLQTVESLIPYVGKFFFILNTGMLKASIVQFLAGYAEERGVHRIIRDVMNVWNTQEDNKKKIPLIEPHEVFGGNV